MALVVCRQESSKSTGDNNVNVRIMLCVAVYFGQVLVTWWQEGVSGGGRECYEDEKQEQAIQQQTLCCASSRKTGWKFNLGLNFAENLNRNWIMCQSLPASPSTAGNNTRWHWVADKRRKWVRKFSSGGATTFFLLHFVYDQHRRRRLWLSVCTFFLSFILRILLQRPPSLHL